MAVQYPERVEILIDAVTGASSAWFAIESGEAPVTVFADGLAGAETADLMILVKDKNPADASGADFVDVMDGGSKVVLDVNTNKLVITSPGVYKFDIAAAAGAVTLGLYK